MTPAQRTGAILAGLRLIERALDEYDGPESKSPLGDVWAVLTNCGAHDAPRPQDIDALCEEINLGRYPLLGSEPEPEPEPEQCPHGYALDDACLDCAADVSNALAAAQRGETTKDQTHDADEEGRV